MKKLRFVKMSGAGNDFILIEHRKLASMRLRAPKLARRLCDRRKSVGADGLLILRRKTSAASLPSVDYYNSDGSRAFCANGSRCAAWWMHRAGWIGNRFIFRTIKGTLQATIAGNERVQLQMPEAKNLRLNLKLRAAARTWTAHSINTGVPHVVIETDNLERLDVREIGRKIRRHKMFSPAGTNVNFIRLHRRGLKGFRGPVLRVRTFERGVEDETLACGTGATAAALCLHALKGLPSPIRVLTQSGDLLMVSFRGDKNYFKNISMEGPAKITFQGEIIP